MPHPNAGPAPTALLAPARAAARALVGPSALDDAAALLDAPWRAAVIGRVGVGKTTLVNRLTGAARPVGLGGVTRAVDPVDHDGVVWVDTPGIDDPWAAIEVLGPVLDAADAVVWVVDGLQPMTRSERDVVDQTLSAGVPLWVVVTKVDLVRSAAAHADDGDAAEVDQVLERVAALAAAHRPVAVVGTDLRSADPAVAEVGRVAPPGPRRLGKLRAAVAAVRTQMGPRPVVPSAEELAARWRSEVRALVRELERQIGDGALSHAVDTLGTLAGRAPEVVEALAVAAGDPPPQLPLPEPPTGGVVEQVVAGMSGASGALRALKAVAGRWMADGEMAIRDDWVPARARSDHRDAWDRLDDALTALDDACASAG